MKHAALERILREQKILVCCGTGGVGKTTTSAALALKAAALGRKAIVVTIDPAKRLATSLGMKTLPDSPLDLTNTINERLVASGAAPLAGRFAAVVPDSEKTFETLVRTLAGNDNTAVARVLKTSIYKIFTKEFSGAHEYMAMEKLYELSTMLDRGEADLIVLDTPPSANTRVFLDAPHLFAGFFDEKLARLMNNRGGKLVTAGVEKVLSLLERLTGQGFLSDLVEFTKALFQLRAQFLENFERIAQLLRAPSVSFLMVTSPERLQRNDTQSFVAALKQEGYPFWGFIVNRVLRPKLGLPPGPARLDPAWYAEAPALKDAFHALEPALRHEDDALQYLQSLKGAETAQIPEQEEDVHSIEALHELTRHF